ncbi:MAG: hypothetical protein ABMB14_39165, partial [Myxococcota bacterium]
MPRVWVDAVTGVVLRVDDGAVSHTPPVGPRARVYPENPVLDLAPIEVTLPLASGGLSDDRLVMLQCRDRGALVNYSDGTVAIDAHVCSPEPAAGPVDGDYLFEPVPYPVDPGRDEDDFVASQVYWNVHQGLDWFDALGWTPLAAFDPYLVVTTNYRATDWSTAETASEPDSALDPYDNAYSSGGYRTYDGAWIAPSLVFGQGSVTDFGYDADVIHHELGHFVVKSQAGPSYSRNTKYGPSRDASLLNEGLADYFAAAIHQRPSLAAYAVGGYDPDLVRDLSGLTTCATGQYGEPHWDSLPFSQGLWAAREAAADPAAFDRVVLDSLSIIGETPHRDDAVDVLLAETEAQLGADAAAALSDAWDARGMLDCPPVLDVALSTAGEEFRRYTLVSGAYEYSTAGEIPGYLQYRVAVPDGGGAFTLSYVQYEDLGVYPFDTPPEPLGLVGAFEPFIGWTREDAEFTTTFDGDEVIFLVEDWITDADVLGEAVEVSVAPYPDDPRYAVHSYAHTWTVDHGGDYTFQLTNAYPRSATVVGLALRFEPAVVDPTTPSTTTPTTPTDDPGDAPAPTSAEEPGGCGCAHGGA